MKYLHTEGDTLARYKVRIDEMYESMNIIEQLVDNIPDRRLFCKNESRASDCLQVNIFSGWKQPGANWGYILSAMAIKHLTGLNSVLRIFQILFIISKLAKGFKIADLVAISGSLDLVIPDIDR